jgi:hypothetical protein
MVNFKPISSYDESIEVKVELPLLSPVPESVPESPVPESPAPPEEPKAETGGEVEKPEDATNSVRYCRSFALLKNRLG